MENPHAARQDALLQRIIKNVVRVLADVEKLYVHPLAGHMHGNC